MNLAILQARMSSSRLPNKVLKKINDKELLLYEIERIQKSKKIDKLIIATSKDSSDDILEEFCKLNNIICFRGSLDNVLSRYYDCAKEFKENNNIKDLNIIRVTGDCPVIDFIVIDEVITAFENGNYDYTSNTLSPTYPDGMDIEVCKFEVLEYAYKNATLKSDREHVTLYIKNSDKFKKYNYKAKVDFSHLRLTVDEQNDFDLIKNILENLYIKHEDFTYLDIVAYMSSNPYLFTINSTIKRDEGLDKSLIEDTNNKHLIEQTKYNKWNKVKQKLNTKDNIIKFNQGNIYFMSVGHNIGNEIYGHNNLFLRPVLVYRKLSSKLFIGIPLTSKRKDGNYYFNFKYKKDISSTALLNQIRVFDIRRTAYYSGYINIKDLAILKGKINDLMNITPNYKKRGNEHASKEVAKKSHKEIGIIISNKNKNVKEK